MHVSLKGARQRDLAARLIDIWRESERVPSSAKAKRPDCPAKVDLRDMGLEED
jgi:hypothetical protein